MLIKYFTTSVGSMCKVAFWVGGVMFKAQPVKKWNWLPNKAYKIKKFAAKSGSLYKKETLLNISQLQ